MILQEDLNLPEKKKTTSKEDKMKKKTKRIRKLSVTEEKRRVVIINRNVFPIKRKKTKSCEPCDIHYDKYTCERYHHQLETLRIKEENLQRSLKLKKN